MNRVKWALKEFQWLGRRSIHAFTGKYYVNTDRYAGVGMISDEAANEYIYKKLSGEEPFALGRTGFSEIGYMCCAQNEIYYHSKVHYHWTPSYINQIELFLKDNGLQRYHAIATDAMDTVDAIGTYSGMFMCDAVLETIPSIKSKVLFNAHAMSPFGNYQTRWTHALAGKKVLVVSPFYKEVEVQYEKRELIWGDKRIPAFDLLTDPSIWIMDNGGFFRSLDLLTDRVLSRDFDIALLGCGQLGLPLAAAIRRSGKKALQLGSLIHFMFGIKGKRWDDFGNYNEYWIRPGEESKPSDPDSIDGATYW